MNKFLKKCAWFFSLLILLNMLYLALLFCASPGFKKVYDVSSLNNKKFELIAIGNSMAADGIDAQLLTNKGINSYNMAVNGSHVSSSLLILDDYLKKNEKPKMIVIGLSSALGRGYLNGVSFKNPEIEFFYHPDLVSNIKNPPLLNFQWLAIDLLKIIASKDYRNAQTIRGQWKTKKVIEDRSVYKDKGVPTFLYSNKYLSEVADLCTQKGIKLILIELPGSNSHRNQLPFRYTVQLKGNQSQTVYNLNNNEVANKFLSSKDWLAPDHLNENGARKLTDFLYNNVIKNEMDLISLKNN